MNLGGHAGRAGNEPRGHSLCTGRSGKSYRRRIRCVRMRSRFTPSQDCVDLKNRVFFADDSIRDWIRGPEATCVIWARIFTPFIRKTSKREFEDFIWKPPTQGQEDTEWLRMRILRLVASSPPDASAELGTDAPCRSSSTSRVNTRRKDIVLEAHKYATDNEPGTKDIYATKIGKMPRSPVNHGVTCRRDAGDTRPTKMEVLDAAIVESPYLPRKIQGHQRLGGRLGGIECGRSTSNNSRHHWARRRGAAPK